MGTEVTTAILVLTVLNTALLAVGLVMPERLLRRLVRRTQRIVAKMGAKQ